jgi:hypothetical protein
MATVSRKRKHGDGQWAPDPVDLFFGDAQEAVNKDMGVSTDVRFMSNHLPGRTKACLYNILASVTFLSSLPTSAGK